MNKVGALTEVQWGCIRSRLSSEVLLTVLSVVFIASVHAFAPESRVELNVNAYYVVIWGAAYALVKRRALAMLVFLLTIAFGTEMAHAYFGQNAGDSNFLTDSVIGLATWSVLVLLFGLLAREANLINAEMRRLQLQRTIGQKVMSARSAALTCMAHELRTPIASVVACMETLDSNLEGKIDDVEKRFLGHVLESSQYLMELVNNLLDYGKAEAGGITLSPQDVSLTDVVEGAVTMIQTQATKRDVKISTQIDAVVTGIVADPFHLKQIILNLLSNAVKHSPAGESVQITVEANKSDVFIHVRDAGQGIASEQVQHIFDPYYQVTNRDVKTGTGLGLGIVKLLVDLHGGSISVESTPGEGSLFSVRLPSSGLQSDSVAIHEEQTWEAAIPTNRKRGFHLSATHANTETACEVPCVS